MRLIVLIRSFNPRRTQFILQDIETRGKSFNPRTHTGRDLQTAYNLLRAIAMFQSTRPHGARQYIQQTPEYLYSKLHFLRDMANIHAKLFLLSPTITNYLKLKHCESIAI